MGFPLNLFLMKFDLASSLKGKHLFFGTVPVLVFLQVLWQADPVSGKSSRAKSTSIAALGLFVTDEQEMAIREAEMAFFPEPAEKTEAASALSGNGSTNAPAADTPASFEVPMDYSI